jgi:hypothetical protein
MFDDQPEKIVCAAIQREDVIILGVRHFDKIMLKCLEIAQLNMLGWEQGFVTNKYRFVNRKEAWNMAVQNDQLCWGKDRETGLLFSEDLY